MKIDILEAYVWISEVFRVKSGFYRSTGRLPEPPGNLMGLSGPWWKRGEEARAGPRAPPPPPVRIGQGEGGAAPPPSPIRTRGRGGAWPFLAAPLSSHQGPCGPLTLRGGSGNPPALRFSPKSPGTLPVSEYSRPICQSLCLGHFETPRHVRDHIRDSEQPSVHQNT